MNNRYYFTDPTGKILGPTLLNDIKIYVETGYVDPTTEICHEYDTDWVSYYKVLTEAQESESVNSVATATATATLEAPMVVQSIENQDLPSAQGTMPFSLLKEMEHRPIVLSSTTFKEPIEGSFEKVSPDIITLSAKNEPSIVHVPVSKILCIIEDADTASVRIELA